MRTVSKVLTSIDGLMIADFREISRRGRFICAAFNRLYWARFALGLLCLIEHSLEITLLDHHSL